MCVIANMPYVAAIKNIRAFGTYAEGWDGLDAQAPTAKAVEDAEVCIRNLQQGRRELPDIALATDGEINFLWSQQAIHLDLGFYGDGTYSYYGRAATGEEYVEDHVPVDAPWPRPLVGLLQQAATVVSSSCQP